MVKKSRKLFSAKTIIGWYSLDNDIIGYEERIILLKAKNFDEAIENGESEIKAHVNDLNSMGSVRTYKYENYIDVFELFDEEVEDLTEVYSLLIDSDMEAQEYINLRYPQSKVHYNDLEE